MSLVDDVLYNPPLSFSRHQYMEYLAVSPNMMIHDREPKFVFIPNLKAGYSSIRAAINQEFPHAEEVGWHAREPAHLSDHFTFSFVRHPVARAISCFADKIVRMPAKYLAMSEMPSLQYSQKIFFDVLKRMGRVDELNTNDDPRVICEALGQVDIDTFIDLLPEILLLDRHYIPQMTCLRHFGALVDACFIGKVENIAADWEYVCTSLRRTIALPHINETRYHSLQKDFKPNERSLLTLNDIYEADFRELGYDAMDLYQHSSPW